MRGSHCLITHRAAIIVLWASALFAARPVLLVAEDAPDDARVSKIRLCVDDREYEWTDGGIAATGQSGESVDGESIRADTIISFLSVRPGLRVPSDCDDELNRLCRESELRLADSGYFYEASVQALPARKDPLERTVLVAVTTGFLWRFGGGNAWGLFGRDAIGGGRNALRMYAGWNRNGMSYTDYHALGMPLVLGGSVFCYAPGRYAGMDSVAGNPDAERAASAGIIAGWFVHPDVLVSVDAVTGLDAFSRDTERKWSVQPAVSWRKYLVPGDSEDYGTESDIGVDARAFVFPADGARKGEVSAFVHGRIAESSALAFKVASGTSDGNAGFDLYMTEDRSVRSGWSASVPFTRAFAFASVEARQRIASFAVPPGFACDLQVFAFTDAALLAGADGQFGDIADAYGAGFRLLFDNPVFAYFSFSYGLSREGAGRFMLCGSAGF